MRIYLVQKYWVNDRSKQVGCIDTDRGLRAVDSLEKVAECIYDAMTDTMNMVKIMAPDHREGDIVSFYKAGDEMYSIDRIFKELNKQLPICRLILGKFGKRYLVVDYTDVEFECNDRLRHELFISDELDVLLKDVAELTDTVKKLQHELNY